MDLSGADKNFSSICYQRSDEGVTYGSLLMLFGLFWISMDTDGTLGTFSGWVWGWMGASCWCQHPSPSPAWSRKGDLEAELFPRNGSGAVPGMDVPAGSAGMLLAKAQG